VIRVLIAASSAITRAGLESLLKDAENLVIAGSVASWEHLISEDADVIVADWDQSVDEIPHEVFERTPKPAIVLLASDVQPATILEGLRTGARAVLLRGSAPNQIVAAIEAAAAGLTVVQHPEDLEPWLANPKAEPLSEPLTAREMEVLAMLAEGLANKVIAYRLGISEHTVKFHVTSILSKLNAASRTEAVTLGIRQGLIML
jgi:two-component system, NarL family, response regulator YdfI